MIAKVMVMEEDQRKLIRDVFGSSSESEDDHGPEEIRSPHPSNLDEKLFFDFLNRNPSWRPVTGITGLWLCSDFLSTDHQASLLSFIQKEGWFSEASHNQAMRFGDLPSWVVELSRCIYEAVSMGFLENKMEDVGNNGSEDCIMPSHLLWREPLFNQLICNTYQPGNLCTCRPDAL